MSRSKDAWLAPDAGDLEEKVLEDVPVKGESVRIRALSATAANGATSNAIVLSEVNGEQRTKVDSVQLDILRFQSGVVDPKFDLAEVQQISAKFGPAFNRVVSEIVKISGLSNEAVAETDARFQGSGSGQAGDSTPESPNGDAGSDQPVRAGRVAGDGD